MYKQILIYVEGLDDKRFFDKIIKPKFEELGYDNVFVDDFGGDKYKGKCKDIDEFIKDIKIINSKPGRIYDYIFVVDLGQFPDVLSRKNSISSRIQHVENDDIELVIVEIESWYLAGLDRNSSKKHGLPNYKNTNKLTKQTFRDAIPRKFKKREIFFKSKILDDFNFENAIVKNDSFKQFYNKFLNYNHL